MGHHLAKKGIPKAIQFEVLSTDGLTPLTGQAGAVTVRLFDEDGEVVPSGVVVTEHGATGFYKATFTPAKGGSDDGHSYMLWIKEPATVTNLRILEETVDSFDVISVTPAGGSTFTTLGNAKEYMGIKGSVEDGRIAALVFRMTAEMQAQMNRAVFRATYTAMRDGYGARSQVLIERPIVSVTSLHESISQTWDASTLIDPTTYAVELETGIVTRRWQDFVFGPQSVRGVYVGGHLTVPGDVEQVCIELVARAWERRKSTAVSSISLADGSKTNFEGVWSEDISNRLTKHANLTRWRDAA